MFVNTSAACNHKLILLILQFGLHYKVFDAIFVFNDSTHVYVAEYILHLQKISCLCNFSFPTKNPERYSRVSISPVFWERAQLKQNL